MYLGIVIGLALCAGLIWFVLVFILNNEEKRSEVARCFEQNPIDWGRIAALIFGASPRRSMPTVVAQPEPVVEVQLPPPSRGNIRPVHGEARDLDPLPDGVHLFPAVPASETLFEEFNRRLFIHTSSSSARLWPETTMDDFPTNLVARDDQLLELAQKHLRPAYPVIIDYYGWWKGASYRLEQDDTYVDPVIATYLAIAPEKRPVVISSPRPAANGSLLFLRYGFEPYSLRRESLDPHLTESLKYVFDAFIGPRKNWMWFSVARLRKAVLSAHRAMLAHAAQVQQEVAVINEATRKAAQKRHANRFAALWDLPLEEQSLVIEDGSDQPTLPEDAAVEADSPTQAKLPQGEANHSGGHKEPKGWTMGQRTAEESA